MKKYLTCLVLLMTVRMLSAQEVSLSKAAGMAEPKNIRSVNPLCTTLWDQGCFYNESCPVDSFGPCYHVVTGCVATAMAQVMKYWNYPVRGTGAHAYVHPQYGTLSADFGSTTYLWSQMNDSLGSTNPAVAELMSYCGIATDMSYGSTSSASGIAATPFKQYFRYSLNATTIYQYNFDSLGWINRLKEELDAGRPILYSGMGQPPLPTGHAWVCDGYDDNDFFHFNWGWSGTFNGFFQMWNFVYSLSNMAIVNLMPVQPCDITIKGLVNPVSSTFTGPVPIRVRVANYDTIAHINIPIAYKVDNEPVVTDIVSDTIPPLTELIVEFGQPFDFSVLPGHIYSLEVYSDLACDGFPANDTMKFAIENVLCSEPDYTMGFEPGELFTGWSITDVNQDGNTWNTGSMGGHSGPWCAYMTSGAQQADDWLISKCISLESSKLYKLSYWYLTPGMFWPQDFQVSMGNSGEPSALTTLLDGYSSITNNTYQPSAVWFTVPAAGSYYFGWHCSSGPNSLDLVIDDISIMEINALDAGVTEALSPAEGCNLQSEEVTVKVRSYSSSVLAEIPVCYTVNGGTPVCDTVYGPIPVGNVFPFTFSVPADLSQAGNYQIRVYTMLAGDTLHNNDTVSFSVYNHVTPVLPYSMGFETFEDYSEWVIEDVNDDNYTWSVIPSGGHYGPGCARYSYSSWIPADDWIITKCLRLYAGRTYRLGFWYKIEDPAWPENLAVYIGSGASSSYLTNLIVDLPGQVNVGWLQSQTLFSVPSDGYYYIGWKCYSAALMFNLYLDDIYLEEIITGICQPFPETSLSVYPNPGNGIFLITDHNPDPGEKRVEVFDGKGILLQSRQFQTGSFEIFLGDEPSGIYLLRIVSQKETRTVRLVKY